MNRSLFITGFIQVLCVAMSTYFIANKLYIGTFATGFLISWIWTHNVKKISISTPGDRYSYALGAGLGSVSGLFLSSNILKLIQLCR